MTHCHVSRRRAARRHEEPLVLECGTCRRLETDLLKLQARGAKVHADAIDANCDRLERERDQLSELIDTWGFCWMEEREALRSLMHEKATDSWHTGWQVAVRERDEARRECDEARAERNARARDVMHLEAELKERGVDIDTLTTALACKRDEYQQLAAQHAITLEERDEQAAIASNATTKAAAYALENERLRALVEKQREALEAACAFLSQLHWYNDARIVLAKARAVLAQEVPS